MDGSTFFVVNLLLRAENPKKIKPMKHVEVLSRQRCFALYDKDSVEPEKPSKPEIDERPHQPKKGQQILTD